VIPRYLEVFFWRRRMIPIIPTYAGVPGFPPPVMMFRTLHINTYCFTFLPKKAFISLSIHREIDTLTDWVGRIVDLFDEP
jgi:hypothetical protein